MQYFNQILTVVLEVLDDSDSSIRELSLSLLVEMVNNQVCLLIYASLLFTSGFFCAVELSFKFQSMEFSFVRSSLIFFELFPEGWHWGFCWNCYWKAAACCKGQCSKSKPFFSRGSLIFICRLFSTFCDIQFSNSGCTWSRALFD